MNDPKYAKLNLHEFYVELSRATNDNELKNVARKYGDTNPRIHEILSFQSLMLELQNSISEDDRANYFSDFYLHFDIVRPSKEFDILKISKNYVLNIELKSKKNENAIKSQLEKNAYYFKHLEKMNYLFANDDTGFYQLKENILEKVGSEEFIKVITLLHDDECEPNNVTQLFSPNAYLISPLNNTKKFINNEYFLTEAQQDCKNEVLSLVNKIQKRQIVHGDGKEVNGRILLSPITTKHPLSMYCAITGDAGTGKTLLLYDIAKNCNGASVIIHCGKLCDGHKTIRKAIKNVDIFGAYDIDNGTIPFGNYNCVFVDEAQRMYEAQLESLLESVAYCGQLCIFSFDDKQMITNSEHNMKNSKKILAIEGIKTYNLTKNIRSNDDIMNFISKIFDLNKTKTCSFKNINIERCSSKESAKELISKYRQEEYVHIEYLVSPQRSAKYDDYLVNMVFGQEFDNVVMTINDRFFYDRGILKSTATYHHNYLYDKMLYQGLTRARKKLAIIVINNDHVYKIINEITLK